MEIPQLSKIWNDEAKNRTYSLGKKVNKKIQEELIYSDGVEE